MASPLNYSSAASPPAPSSRPVLTSLALPGASTNRRKPSIASATSSAHPLRQTSFPPQDSLEAQHAAFTKAQYSPTDSVDVSDSEINGPSSDLLGSEDLVSIGGGGGRSKKRKRKGPGRPPKNAALRAGSQSLLNGDDNTSSKRANTAGASILADNDEDDEPDEEVGGKPGHAIYEGGSMTAAELAKRDMERSLLYNQLGVGGEYAERWTAYRGAMLKKEAVRRLVNATLSQSVPDTVMRAVNAYVKMFAGQIIERARDVQEEWHACTPEIPVDPSDESKKEPNPAYERAQSAVLPDGGVEAAVRQENLGPLMPDHLREALRRYKADRHGGTVGFTGISQQGRVERAAGMGGKRLFR